MVVISASTQFAVRPVAEFIGFDYLCTQLAVNGDRMKAVLVALRALEPGFELVTIYYGDGAELAEAKGVAAGIGESFPGVEVEVIHGGQPHYRYLIAAE